MERFLIKSDEITGYSLRWVRYRHRNIYQIYQNGNFIREYFNLHALVYDWKQFTGYDLPVSMKEQIMRVGLFG
jgi:hypothetical protein